MKDFIKINEERVRKSTIKKYQPFGTLRLNVYFNVSRYKIEVEMFDFRTTEERDSVVELLDIEFGITN